MLSRMANEYGFGTGLAAGFAPLLRLHNEMNRLWEQMDGDAPVGHAFGAGYPALNTWEDGNDAYVEAELPGLSMDEVEVLVAGNELTISGERKLPAPGEATWHRRERTGGRFARTLTLPWPIDADKVEARLQDGVLTVRLPRSESCRPKKVNVLTS